MTEETEEKYFLAQYSIDPITIRKEIFFFTQPQLSFKNLDPPHNFSFELISHGRFIRYFGYILSFSSLRA